MKNPKSSNKDMVKAEPVKNVVGNADVKKDAGTKKSK